MITLNSNLIVFVSTDPYGDMHTRSPRVLVNHFLGSKVEGVKSQNPKYSGNHRGGCDVVFPGHIQFPFRV